MTLLRDQIEPPQVLLRPPDIRDHSSQGSDRERVPKAMIGDDDAPPVGMMVDVVAASRPRKLKPIMVQCSYQLPCRESAWNCRHTLTTTDGMENSVTPRAGPVGTASPDSIRSST